MVMVELRVAISRKVSPVSLHYSTPCSATAEFDHMTGWSLFTTGRDSCNRHHPLIVGGAF
jgi:hypothetical protein